MFLVEDLFDNYGKKLGLELVSGSKGLKRKITVPESQRPGLALSGYLKNHAGKRILLFGKVEVNYLKDLPPQKRTERLEDLLNNPTPAVILARRYRPPRELSEVCERKQIPLFRSQLTTMHLFNRLNLYLSEEFAPSLTCHGTLVEVFGVGLLIKGDSAVGKSEAALGLIERGHRLISDDVVKIFKREAGYVEGTGAGLTRHHMEIRGIGIVNVAHLYGVVCVRECKCIDLVVKLEPWNDETFYDRVGMEDNYTEILGIKVPFSVMPVKPGRDVVLLLETIALNRRLKDMGYNSAKELNNKLLHVLSQRQGLNPAALLETTGQ